MIYLLKLTLLICFCFNNKGMLKSGSNLLSCKLEDSFSKKNDSHSLHKKYCTCLFKLTSDLGNPHNINSNKIIIYIFLIIFRKQNSSIFIIKIK